MHPESENPRIPERYEGLRCTCLQDRCASGTMRLPDQRAHFTTKLSLVRNRAFTLFPLRDLPHDGLVSPTRCESERPIVADRQESNRNALPEWIKGPTPVLHDQQEANSLCMGTTSTRPAKGIAGKVGMLCPDV